MIMIETAINECRMLGRSLIRRCTNEEDAIAIAVAFAEQAQIIYRELGGSRLVAAQFYNIADRAAVEK